MELAMYQRAAAPVNAERGWVKKAPRAVRLGGLHLSERFRLIYLPLRGSIL